MNNNLLVYMLKILTIYLVSQINNKLLSFVQQDEKIALLKTQKEKYIGSGYLSQSSMID